MEAADQKQEEQKFDVPSQLPLIPLRDVVIFPYMIFPLFIGREKSVKAVDKALSENRMVILVTQKDASVEEPTMENLYEIGTAAVIMRMLKLPDGKVKALVQGISRARVLQITSGEYIQARIEKVETPATLKKTVETEAMMRSAKQMLEQASQLGKQILPDILAIAASIDDPGRLADLIISNLEVNIEQSQEILSTIDPIKRLKRVSEFLSQELELLKIQQEIRDHAKDEMDKSQREYYLRQQLRAIQKELGEEDELRKEIEEYREKINEENLTKEAMEVALKQLKRLEMMHPESSEAGVVRTYLDWIIELPWKKSTQDNLDLKRARKILDEDHYDLDKVKERIIEYLAVRQLKEKMKGPILCFVGPPGTGKTSLGRSIARALGRNFVRISLGGVRDEAEIRGHRRTYVGALPGRIIQGIRQAGSNNPVFMMDEVDKIGADFRGDPSAALLEVLDPEQNFDFRDHYLEIPFDLSNVMFITTANLLEPIHPAFIDRMEVLFLPGYIEEEKLQIANKFLIPKQLEENGITQEQINISQGAIRRIINRYTREAGVRNLERSISTLCRKVATKIVEGDKGKKLITVNNLGKYLGPPQHIPETELMEDKVGVVMGVAVTPTGGDIIFIETTIMPGKGNLTLTGQLGEVMKESAMAALAHLRANTEKLKIPQTDFSKVDIHIHVPAGAIPKDGPSAGIAICCSLYSALTKIPMPKDIAMTGEITLRGRVLRIGGIKQKMLAAKRAGADVFILPAQNKVDIDEIESNIKKGIAIKLFDDIDDVINYVFYKSREDSK